jgi:hypothetical protein
MVKLQREVWELKRVHLATSTIWTWLRDEGLRGQRHQTWFD